MASASGSTPAMRPDLQRTRRALSLRYGVLVLALLLVFALGVYGQVSRSRWALQRQAVEELARTASSGLPLLHHEHDEMQRADTPAPIRAAAHLALADDGALADQNLRIRWYDDQLRELKSRGGFRPAGSSLPPPSTRERPQWLPLANGLALWQPVLRRNPAGGAPRLEGFVSVALASAASEAELARLRQALAIGAALAALVGFAASGWMVSASLEPIRRQIERLIRFTADASHELRHPLTAIRALIGSLRHGDQRAALTPQLAHKLNQIDASAARMGRLVDDLLLLSRSDRAIHEASPPVLFPLEDLLDDLIDLHRAKAEAQGLVLQGQIEGSALVRGQPEGLRRLLENLLSNALRFSPPAGTVTLGLARRRERVRVWVDDQGPGIPPEQRAQVFERFWQADAARSGPDHHGLGLSIALAIAQANGGRLQAQQAPGGGCRMVLHLPAQG